MDKFLYPWLTRRCYCEHLWMRISVRRDASVEPCSCATSRMPSLPFRRGGLHEIWNDPLFIRTRQYLLDRHRSPAEAVDEIFDCCINCPVAPHQRFQTAREYYGNLAAIILPPRNPYQATKLDNLARLQNEIAAGATLLSAFPVWANIDPCNVCNLRCPECLVGRRELAQVPGAMELAQFEAIMEELGPSLIFLELYRYGEPLLNRDTPAMIELAARKYGIACRLSSNFSMELDHAQIRALAGSGLRQLVIAADDIEQESYAQYRRGGHIEVVRDNLARLVACRKALGRRQPQILWQALRLRFNETRQREIGRQVKAWGANRFAMVPAYLSQASEALVPVGGERRGRLAARRRRRQIVAASISPPILQAGNEFRLAATVLNNLTWETIPAERPGDAHPIRIGVKLLDARGQMIGDLGRICINQPIPRGTQVSFNARFIATSEPELLARLAALSLDLVAEFQYWFEDQMDIQSTPFVLPVKIVA